MVGKIKKKKSLEAQRVPCTDMTSSAVAKKKTEVEQLQATFAVLHEDLATASTSEVIK